MPVTYKFNEEQIEELKSAQKRNKDKNVEKRLNALLLRAEGKSRKEVAYITGYKYTYITQLTTKYMQKGLKAITDNHYKGNCRNMTYEQEETLLEKFKKSSENGQIVETSEIKEAYDKAIGHKTGRSQIYYIPVYIAKRIVIISEGLLQFMIYIYSNKVLSSHTAYVKV